MRLSAQPILASSLLARETRLHNIDDMAGFKPETRRLSLPAQGINSMFNGGFAYGSLSCITTGIDVDSQDLVHALVAAHLVSDAPGRVVIIDTTLAFDVRRLHGTLTAAVRAQDDATETAGVMKLLDRVQIMQVFDYLGLAEALDELQGEDMNFGPSKAANTTPDNAPRPGTIADSQDDEEETYNEAATEGATVLPSTTGVVDELPSNATPALVIIQDLAQVILPLLKNNYAQGQAQLNSLLRSVRHFTSANDCCTVVLSRASARIISAVAATTGDEDNTEVGSQFAEKTIRPALGHGLGYLVDMHLFYYRLSVDSAGAGGATAVMGANATVNVLEVVEDRREGILGRWASFTFNDSGIIQDVLA